MPVTFDLLCEQRKLSIDQLAAQTNLPPSRIEAIIAGRWLPSPAERQALAAACEVAADDVSWGHTMSPRNVRYHRYGLPEGF